ncbi:MAG TPA: T9SS type A sorting domain-containing protein [Flavobacteriales bacterium]|nr:T9SS type A sorting domain-containing protein [Flavobacteriales bacterium]
MKKNYFLFGFLCLTAFSFAQKNIYYTELQPDSTNSHYVRSFDKIGNNGYVICSQSSYYTSENDVLLTVTDKDGLQIGSINYDFGASEDGGDVISTSDGGFLFSGSTGGSFLSGIPTEALVVKVDSAGTIQWSKKAVDTTNLIYSIAKDLVENPNGTFTILGEANGNLFLWNLDGSGDTVWTTLYQDSVFEVPKRLLRHSNGDFTILSRTVSQGMLAPYIIRVDANGDKLWSKIYNTGADFGPEGIIESSDGGYVVVGHIKTQITPTIDADAATMKLDASGSVKWLVSHGKYQPNKASSEEGFGLTETFDGGYAIAGLTNSYSNLSGFQDIYFYKLDSAGTLLWTKLYGESDGTNNAAVDVFENTDSTLSIAGRHMTNPPFIFFQSHTFILKTSFRGDIGCLEKDSLPDTTNTYSVVVTIPNESIMSYANTQDIMGVKTFEPLTQVTTCINADTSTYYTCTSSVVLNETACDSYNWVANGLTYTLSGTYVATLINTAGCDSVVTLNLTIDTVDVSVSQTDSVLTANDSSATYQWLNCNNGFAPVSGAVYQSFTPSAIGNYAVEVQKNGCVDTSACYSVTALMVKPNYFDASLLISPNPTSGKVYIDLGKQYESFAVIIRDITGKIVSENFLESATALDVFIPGNIGLYFIEVRTGKGLSAIIKVMKE